MSDRPLGINDDAIAARLDGIRFHSATWRLFKLDGLEPRCEDYGQAVTYRGTIPDHPRLLRLDAHHAIEAGRVFPACGNTWRMLADTRFAPHFDFHGDRSRHFGVFPGCGTSSPFRSAQPADRDTGASCC